MTFARRVAATDVPILLTGESGTGKEFLARSIHRVSRRASRPFKTVNCALPEAMVELELFGHLKSSFADAFRKENSLLKQADGGTLFIEDVAELTSRIQGLLLRFLETRDAQQIGSDRSERLDVRIITATTRNLEQLAREGTFREDLFYSLSVVRLMIPPLRDRREDILPLSELFLAETARRLNRAGILISPEARELLLMYPWPGNVRELRNVLRRAALSGGDVITPRHLPLLRSGGREPQRSDRTRPHQRTGTGPRTKVP